MTKLFLRIDFRPDLRLGPGKIRLVELIAETGSISEAARRMGNMSYRRAWLLVESLNRTFAEPVVATRLGGAGGGGAQVTPFGTELVRRYRALENAVADHAAEELAGLERALNPA